jgi:hypothetical protein
VGSSRYTRSRWRLASAGGVDLIAKGVSLRGRPGHFDDMRPSHLEEWRQLGEVGQLLVGLHAGYTEAEIAAKRQWSPTDRRRYFRDALTWLRARHA